MSHTTPPLLEELRRLRRPISNINLAHRGLLSPLERFAVSITTAIGSMGFFLVIFLWTSGWFLWNMLAPRELIFDPFPAFVLWIFISNMLQLFFLPLLMVGQKLQDRHAELRAEADFEVNQKAEREIEAILAHLERQQAQIADILARLPSERSR